MMFMGESILGYRKVLDPADIEKRLMTVTPEDVRSVACHCLDRARLGLAVVGPLKNEDEIRAGYCSWQDPANICGLRISWGSLEVSLPPASAVLHDPRSGTNHFKLLIFHLFLSHECPSRSPSQLPSHSAGRSATGGGERRAR